MLKENGRQINVHDSEKASKSRRISKKFVCECGNTRLVDIVEFGEEELCNCGKCMIEDNGMGN